MPVAASGAAAASRAAGSVSPWQPPARMHMTAPRRAWSAAHCPRAEQSGGAGAQGFRRTAVLLAPCLPSSYRARRGARGVCVDDIVSGRSLRCPRDSSPPPPLHGRQERVVWATTCSAPPPRARSRGCRHALSPRRALLLRSPGWPWPWSWPWPWPDRGCSKTRPAPAAGMVGRRWAGSPRGATRAPPRGLRVVWGGQVRTMPSRRLASVPCILSSAVRVIGG